MFVPDYLFKGIYIANIFDRLREVFFSGAEGRLCLLSSIIKVMFLYRAKVRQVYLQPIMRDLGSLSSEFLSYNAFNLLHVIESSGLRHITLRKLGFKEAAQENDDYLAIVTAALCLTQESHVFWQHLQD